MLTKLSIIIPAYNEEETITKLLNKVKNSQISPIKKEIILINDSSTHQTKQKIDLLIQANPTLDIIFHQQTRNQGKGAAIRQGIKQASGEYLLIQDADLEYDPDEYALLLAPVQKADADVVYGSRFMGSKPHRILFFWHSIGNKFLTFLSNMFTNLNLTDMETCYKLFRTRIIQTIPLNENKFGFEPEITAKIARIPNIRIFEVGISYYGRTYDEGKKINWKDGVHAIFCILKYNTLWQKK